MVINAIGHVGICVTDMDRSLRFWRDGLGFEILREFEFRGIACRDIVRVQVVGGDRCDMGDLDKYSAAKGQCLARVRVVASDLIPFEK